LRFLADSMIGKLAKFLRMIDVDVTYCPPQKKREILEMATRGERVLLTRNAHVANELPADQCFYIKSNNPREQFAEVVERFDISIPEKLFTRCLQCNSPMEEVSAEEVADRVPRRVLRSVDEFHYCRQCDKVFWQGSHTKRMAREVLGTIRS
jgi:uncharacterized protein with PIN domain